MTRAMDQLILTRAVYRRRYGTDLPEASVPSRFLEEVPATLIEELGTARRRSSGVSPQRTEQGVRASTFTHESSHYSYEDEDQSAAWHSRKEDERDIARQKAAAASRPYSSIDNIAQFFATRGKKFSFSKPPVEEPTGKRGFRPGQKVRHPKYGEGTVYQREGEGEEAKITVQFPRFGLKKLVEKYAQLERA
jgi:DNA helicase II / ATP-dependent DNA helicase PcrA